jgi:hypothetical protein
MNWYKRKAGTWAVPFTAKQAYKVSDVLQSLNDYIGGTLRKKLYGALGDDVLWDKMDKVFDDAAGEIKGLIKAHIKETLAHYEKSPDDFSGKFDEEALEVLKELSEYQGGKVKIR